MSINRKTPNGSNGKIELSNDKMCHHPPWDNEKTHGVEELCSKHYLNSIGINIRSMFFLRPIGETSKSDEPVADLPRDKELWPKYFATRNKEILQKEINLNGYRSDNFIKTHKDHHVLFLGCSYTWGSGLFLEETWSKVLYNKIKQNKKMSGYFNLGYPGDSVLSQVVNAFKYCKSFGNPDVIFFNIPDLNRFYAYSKGANSIVKALTEENENGLIRFLSLQYYYMLDQYCNSNNIKLISFSWAYEGESIKKSGIQNFSSFNDMDTDDMHLFIEKYKKDNPHDDALDFARDNAHLGKAYHAYWANFIFNKYEGIS